MRRLAAIAVLSLVLSACSGTAEPESAPGGPTQSAGDATSQPGKATESEAPTGTPSKPPHPVSLQALMDKEYDGGNLRLGRVELQTAAQTQYDVTYRSGDLTISGRLAVPNGDGPFPAIVLAHGYIDPAIYTIGRGMTRERAWFADNGYIALHVDYRNHGGSDTDPTAERNLRLGYTEDVINAVLALRAWDGPVDDERVAVGGRSMGGGVVYNLLAVEPGLVGAGVVWAPVSSDTIDNFERWIRPNAGRADVVRHILREYGDPADSANAEFWANASPRTFFEQVTEPVLIHHGTSDDTCPIRWSRATHRTLQQAGVDSTFEVYEGEEHAFGPQFFASMERTGRFLDQHLG